MILSLLLACTPDDDAPKGASDGFVLGSVVITPDGRTTYFQVVPELDGEVTNEAAVEAPGNGVILSRGRDVFLGLAESPEWVKYTVAEDGTLAETGRLSLANEGFSYVDYGNVLVSDEVAVSVSSASLVAVVWNPRTMQIVRTIPLPHLQRDGYDVEVWTTVAQDGLVYVPSRWSDWTGGRIWPGVQTTILDPVAGEIVAIATDDRCASGGRAVRGDDGYTYVMGDGRSYSAQMFANAGGDPAPANCLLRIPPGETAFDPDWSVEIPSLTGGLEVATELETPAPGSSTGFAWMFHEDELPDGVEPVDFGFWGYPVFGLWRLALGDEPTAAPVEGVPHGVLGFGGSAVDGNLYVGLGDTEQSVVYEVSPDGEARETLTMDGYFYHLARLE